MINLIAHRKNTIRELKATPKHYGVEVDIRSKGDQLIIEHEPFKAGIDLLEWLNFYDHRTLILNVKEEGLEERLISLMNQYRINDYFFLDQSFPFLVKYSKIGFTKSAVRVSEFESLETAVALSGKVDWVWVDFFTRFPLTNVHASSLQSAGFNLCLVSPELQGFEAEIFIPKLYQFLRLEQIHPEAICTKRPELWEQQFE